jgi:DNA polymerase-1
MPTRQSKVILVDGDVWLYKALFASEETLEGFDGAELMLDCNMEKAQKLFDETIRNLLRITSVENDVIIALSDKLNFRKDLYADYKKQRKSHRRPIGLSQLRTYVCHRYVTAAATRLEADDVLGILATGSTLSLRKKLIVSVDKDLLQIPGLHFNPDKAQQGVIKVTKEEGDRLHLLQTLTGDTVDNYPGCPGIGPVRAEKILAGADDPWAAVVQAYEKKGLGEEDALLQARLARILQEDTWDQENKEPILWTPSSG